MHSLIQYAILSLFILAAFSVDENKFRKCTQAGFCSRHRSKPVKNQVFSSPVPPHRSTVTIVLCQSHKCRPFWESADIRARYKETSADHPDYERQLPQLWHSSCPYHRDKPSWWQTTLWTWFHLEIRYFHSRTLSHRLIAAIEPKLFTVKEQTDNSITLSSVNGNSLLKIKFNEFKLEFYVQNELRISINDQYAHSSRNHAEIEICSILKSPEERKRSKLLNLLQQNPPRSLNPKRKRKSSTTMKLVSHFYQISHLGQPIYADGSLGASPSETTTEESTEDQPAAPVETANEEEKEDETGYWSESFGGHTDTKPYGPQVFIPLPQPFLVRWLRLHLPQCRILIRYSWACHQHSTAIHCGWECSLQRALSSLQPGCLWIRKWQAHGSV